MTHQVTEETRKTAKNGAGLGLPYHMIATLLGISENTLVKRYKKDLAEGKATATVNVLQTLYKRCLAGSDTAIIWYTKTQLGWRERTALEVATPPGQPFETKQTYVPAGPALLADYYAKLEQAAQAAGTDPAAPRDLGPGGPEGDEPGEDPEISGR
jgi:hypothetical protein